MDKLLLGIDGVRLWHWGVSLLPITVFALLNGNEAWMKAQLQVGFLVLSVGIVFRMARELKRLVMRAELSDRQAKLLSDLIDLGKFVFGVGASVFALNESEISGSEFPIAVLALLASLAILVGTSLLFHRVQESSKTVR
ncbi:hypothetical protein [Maritalea porphyrae]|uniref:Uncharacterized protein n=1 Tax=Maritalea porphyrae TaxID=880732 RepID=A0ABQ5UMT8_9HYPH|nr:hypothetical protein [Maritalea porphyrae]GLQ16351.1 hypothetical protein GCM10007879_06000 [Maritalea porphyrae]